MSQVEEVWRDGLEEQVLIDMLMSGMKVIDLTNERLLQCVIPLRVCGCSKQDNGEKAECAFHGASIAASRFVRNVRNGGRGPRVRSV